MPKEPSNNSTEAVQQYITSDSNLRKRPSDNSTEAVQQYVTSYSNLPKRPSIISTEVVQSRYAILPSPTTSSQSTTASDIEQPSIKNNLLSRTSAFTPISNSSTPSPPFISQNVSVMSPVSIKTPQSIHISDIDEVINESSQENIPIPNNNRTCK